MTTFPPIAELVPQAGAMILLDEIVDAEEGRIVARARLRPTSLFVEGDRVPALVSIEYMAQAIGAYAGLRARAAGEPVRVGYLLGTRELTLEIDGFDVGDEFLVEARHVWGDEQLGSFQCAVVLDGRTVATALVTVYQGDEVPST
jgi:predicted hotdog family 3-hydroxylacyl-ACP dehydratase